MITFPFPLSPAARRLSHRLLPLLAVGAGLLTLPPTRADAASFTTIYTFTPATDGNVPFPALVQGADGKLYGTNSTGGKNNNGTVFALDPSGAHFDVLSSFPDTNGGVKPEGGLVQARDGNFYGTTFSGGGNSLGVLYQVTPAGTLTYLPSFNNGDPGSNPVGTLVEGLDGYLYGTAEYGGLDGFGTIFRATVPGSTATTLATFATLTGGLAGAYPDSSLIQALDGNFYGTTTMGGTANNGTFFKVTPAGVYTVLYNFTGDTDGGTPLRGVIQGVNGYFYGVTTSGGTYNSGTIYRINPAAPATVTVLYAFDPLVGDGTSPDGELVQATDGNFYGTTAFGGANELGTVYGFTPSGAFATVYSFGGTTDGGNPVGGLTEASNGKLYGTTAGQNGSSGTVFQLDFSLPVPAPRARFALQTTAAVGDTVLIKGDYFVGVTGVSFTAANSATTPSTSVDVLSRTLVRAVVPAAAVTGPIIVTSAAGSSATGFSLTVTGAPTPTPTPTPPTTPTPAPTPAVTVIATDPVATKVGGNNGTLKVYRSGDTSQALTVLFKVKGSAVRGTDYNLVTSGETLASVTNSVTIPAGATKVKLKVVPVTSSAASSDQTVIFKLKAGTGYDASSPNKATVEIAGNTGG